MYLNTCNMAFLSHMRPKIKRSHVCNKCPVFKLWAVKGVTKEQRRTHTKQQQQNKETHKK